jgi:DNA helicase-2/ATP-dependent DNA helicase PcrA
LRRLNIKYRVVGGLSFYQRKETEDVLAYLRFVVNQNDEEAFKRIINLPKRGIGDTTIAKIAVTGRIRFKSFLIQPISRQSRQRHRRNDSGLH